MAMVTLTVVVNANTLQANQAFVSLNAQVKTFHDNFKAHSLSIQSIGTFLGNVFYNLARNATSALMGIAVSAVKYSNELNNGLISLSNVARAFGLSADTVTNAARKLSENGMLPLKDSVTGLRNLLMTGFNLDQSVKIMNALADSAVFARQSTYSYADAIRTATEGLKNTRSVQFDNAGVTKNLSVIMKEYGFQMQDLADKQKGAAARQAFVTGLMRETAAQQGDAARSLATVQGAVNALKGSWVSFLATVGDVITRSKAVMIVVQAVGDFVRWLTTQLTDNSKGFYLVSDALEMIVRAMSGVVKAINFLHTAFTYLDTGIMYVVAGITTAWAKMIGVILKGVELIAKFSDVIPGMTAGFALLLPRINEFVLQQKDLQTVSAAANKRIEDNKTSLVTWSEKTKQATDALDKLADKIHATRGQAVLLSDAFRPPGPSGGLDNLGDAAAKNAKKLKALQDIIDSLGKKLKVGFAGLGEIGWKLDLDRVLELPDAKLNAAIDDLKKKTVAGLSGLTLPGFKYGKLEQPKLPFVSEPLQKALADFSADFPKALADAFRNSTSIFGAVAKTLASSFGDVFQRQLQKAADQKIALTSEEKKIGMVSMGLDAAISGYQIGAEGGTKKGIIGGAASGAAAGLPLAALTGGISVAVGAGIGAIAGIFGGGAAKKKAKQELAAAKKALTEQYGGMEKLKKLAESLGVNISAAFNATKIEDFNKAVGKLNTALEAQKAHLEALKGVMEAVNTRTALFADKFKKAFEDSKTAAPEGADDAATAAAAQTRAEGAKKLFEIAQRTQPEFERLGIIIRDTFAGIIREGGSAYDAIIALAPSFAVLESGVEQWGLTSTAVIDELLANYKLLNDEGLKPMFEAITANGTILKGLMDAKALSPEGFQAIAADIGAQLQGIADKGGDMARALALSQPVLQALWEAQQTYGGITDETTQAILKQAEEQGLVGAAMKSVNEKILDVLLAIGKVLNADLPRYFDNLVPPAQRAADGIEDAFNKIDVQTIDVPYKTRNTGYGGGETGTPDGVVVPALARGGIVRRPTLALVGEAGPEAVVPLSGSRLGMGTRGGTAILEVEGRTLAEIMVPAMPGVIKRYGLR